MGNLNMPGFVPAAEPLYVSAKVAKTIGAPSGLFKLGGRRAWMRAGQLAEPGLSLVEGLRQGPPVD
jgi:hypothetical protein